MFPSDIQPGSMQRFALYLHYLRTFDPRISPDTTTRAIAHALNLKADIVRKDIQSLFPEGKSLEYDVTGLMHALERCVGHGRLRVAVLVGAGKLGRTLLSYAGFTAYDMDIIAGFDIAPRAIANLQGKPIYPMRKFSEICHKLGARVGVITTPGGSAQAVCDEMVKTGILSIWNFTSVKLSTPENVLIVNADMSATLMTLMEHAYGASLV